MTEWKEYSVHINQEAEESVIEILLDLGSKGVNIIDRNDFEALPEYGFDTLWELDENKFPADGVIIKGYFSLEEIDRSFEKTLHQKLEALKAFDLNVKDYTVEVATIMDEDWQNKWKEFYQAVRVTRYLTIVPEWEKHEKDQENEQFIIMDPGLAFGTGTHPTTQLSIQALETVLRGDEVVLDVGTGSGVLTIASSLLGAKEVFAYDVDEIAVDSAKNNIALNDLDSKITVKENNLLKDVTIKADIVVANILASIILRMLEDAKRVLNPGGYFIASGILSTQETDIREKFEAAGFKIRQINQMEDWIVVIAQKTMEKK